MGIKEMSGESECLGFWYLISHSFAATGLLEPSSVISLRIEATLVHMLGYTDVTAQLGVETSRLQSKVLEAYF